MTSKDKKYWIIFAAITLLVIAGIIYLYVRPYSHKPEEGQENNNSTPSNNMQTPNHQYDTTKRGYRNNNPLNIRLSGNNWKGEIKPSQDKAFCQFETMAYGFRAAMVNIRTYNTKYGIKTLQDIINKWAPWTDGNNPIKYASHIMKTFPDTFPDKDVVIDYTNREQMTRLVYAMAIVENGSAPLMADCQLAFSLM